MDVEAFIRSIRNLIAAYIQLKAENIVLKDEFEELKAIKGEVDDVLDDVPPFEPSNHV